MAFLHRSAAEEGYQLLFLQYLCRSCILQFSCDIASVFSPILRISLRTVSIANLTPLSRRAAHIGR